MMLTPTEQILLLQSLPETGSAAYWRLLDAYPSLKCAMAAPLTDLARHLSPQACTLLREVRCQGEQHALIRRLREDLRWLEQHGVTLVDTHHEYYPAMLNETRRAPPLLYVWGDPGVLSMPQIAVVGSRSPTPGG